VNRKFAMVSKWVGRLAPKKFPLHTRGQHVKYCSSTSNDISMRTGYVNWISTKIEWFVATDTFHPSKNS